MVYSVSLHFCFAFSHILFQFMYCKFTDVNGLLVLKIILTISIYARTYYLNAYLYWISYCNALYICKEVTVEQLYSNT